MSKIEWTEKTWNPIVGCSKVSQGCKYCYAEVMAKRLKAMGQQQYQTVTDHNGRWNGNMVFVPTVEEQPDCRKKPTVYFVNSMSDLFHENVNFEWLEAVWLVMSRNPRHIFQILTKRAARMPKLVSRMVDKFGVLNNVWLGVSVEDQAAANERIPFLCITPASIRFLSVEPLLGPVDLFDVDNQISISLAEMNPRQLLYPFELIDWVIVGGESGPNARPMKGEWVTGIRDQCNQAKIPFFFKQAGNILAKEWGCTHRKGGDPDEWSKEFRVREFPYGDRIR